MSTLLVEHPVTTVEELVEQADDALARGDLQAVRSHLGAALDLDPANAGLALALGNVKLYEHDLAGALEDYEHATRIAPRLADAHGHRALILQLLNRPDEAAAAATVALVLEPGNVVALKVMIRINLDAHQFEVARDYGERLLERNPSDPDAFRFQEQYRPHLMDVRVELQDNPLLPPSPFLLSFEQEPRIPALPSGSMPTPVERRKKAASPSTASLVVSKLFHPPLNTFDAYISLGNNCEAGLQFERIGCEQSSFFRFTYSPYEATLSLIRNDFAGVFLKENLIPVNDGMAKDKKYGITFHSQLFIRQDSASGEKRFVPGPNFDHIYEQEQGKIRYFINKWNALARSAQRTLYIIKHDGGCGKQHAEELADLLTAKYPGHCFTVLFLQTEEHREAGWPIPNVVNRYFPRFAPTSDAHDGHLRSWDQIFAEFPLRAPSLSRTDS